MGGQINLITLMVIIVLVVVGIYFLWRAWKKGTPTPSYSPFTLDYGSIGEPGVSFEGYTPVPTYIPPENIAQLYTDTFTVSDGDTLILQDGTGLVYQRKVLELDFLSRATGDWSLLVNLLHQLQMDNLMTGDYWLTIERAGKIQITIQLKPNLEELDFFPTDPRLNLPAELYRPFFVGDLLFIADPLTKVAEYIFYCINDQNGGIFKLHEHSPQKNIDTLPFVMINSLFPGKFVGVTNAQWEEIRSFTTFKNQPEVINTSVGYEAYFDTYPGPMDPTVLNMIPNETKLTSGDTINIWSYASSTYFTIPNVKLESESSTELSDDTKYLISGVYSLIKNKNLYEWTIEIVRNGIIVLSKIIPTNVTGVKFFNDPRLTLMQYQDSVVIGDIIKTETTPASTVQYFWAINAPMKLYTNGKEFMGTYEQLVEYFKTLVPKPTQVKFTFSNQYSSEAFKTVTVPLEE